MITVNVTLGEDLIHFFLLLFLLSVFIVYFPLLEYYLLISFLVFFFSAQSPLLHAFSNTLTHYAPADRSFYLSLFPPSVYLTSLPPHPRIISIQSLICLDPHRRTCFLFYPASFILSFYRSSLIASLYLYFILPFHLSLFSRLCFYTPPSFQCP